MTDLPLVTVVMPVRNEAGFIARALHSIIDQSYPAERLEVIVVDGCSDDETTEEVEQLVGEAGPGAPPISILTNPSRSVPAAMNLGLACANGEIVLRVDGHCELCPEYVAVCVDRLRATGAGCVGGVLVTRSRGPVGEAIAAAQSSRFGAGGAAFRTGTAEGRAVDTVAFGAYRREVFDLVGAFDEELVRNQDDELNLRLTRAGWVIWLEPTIHAVYHARSSLRSLARQYFQYGLFKVRVAQKHRTIGSARQLAPAALILAMAASLGAHLAGRPAPMRVLAAAYGGTALLESARHRPADLRAAATLPVVYVTMHLAYGGGYLVGLGYWTLPRRRHEWRLSR